MPRLFRQVLIPPQISAELSYPNRPLIVREWIASPPSWLQQRAPVVLQPIAALHAGEIAAISLAQELKADLLLIDETRGRKAAADRNIPFAGTVGVLELAADRALLELADAFERLKSTDFWISPALLDRRLRIREARRNRAR